MNTKIKALLPGFLAGLIFPFILGAIIYSLNGFLGHENGGLYTYWIGVSRGLYVFSPFIRLGCLINLGIFFLLLRFNRDMSARGVMIGTIVWGVYVVVTYLIR